MRSLRRRVRRAEWPRWDPEDLLDRIARGDDEALAAAYDRLAPAAHRLACLVLPSGGAAEVTREAFVELWRRAPLLEVATPTVEVWVLSTTHRLAVAARQERRPTCPPGSEPS